MKKIPTLFERQYENHKVVGITETVTPGMEWVLAGDGEATVKWDGSACAVIDGKYYKRYDAKKGKTPPKGALPCQAQPDPVTGHWPHWVELQRDNPADKWYLVAFDNGCTVKNEATGETFSWNEPFEDGTYEAVGPHFQGNPYNFKIDCVIKHGVIKLPLLQDRSFDGIKKYLQNTEIEGIVFWKDGEPRCKIKRSDFGFAWPVKREET